MKQTKIISADGGKWDLSADDTVALLQSLGVAACSGLGIAAPRSEEGRRGFGRVYLRDGSSSMKAMLARLGWRPTGPHEPAAKLNGCLYHDDPFQVGQPFADDFGGGLGRPAAGEEAERAALSGVDQLDDLVELRLTESVATG